MPRAPLDKMPQALGLTQLQALTGVALPDGRMQPGCVLLPSPAVPGKKHRGRPWEPEAVSQAASFRGGTSADLILSDPGPDPPPPPISSPGVSFSQLCCEFMPYVYPRRTSPPRLFAGPKRPCDPIFSTFLQKGGQNRTRSPIIPLCLKDRATQECDPSVRHKKGRQLFGEPAKMWRPSRLSSFSDPAHLLMRKTQSNRRR